MAPKKKPAKKGKSTKEAAPTEEVSLSGQDCGREPAM